MSSFFRTCLALSGILLIIALVVGAGLFVVSGGDPVDYVRMTLLRFSVESRSEQLETPAGTDDTPVRFAVNSGDAPVIIAQNLAANGLITDSELFVDWVRLEGLDTQLEAGIYFLNQTQTIPEIAQMLTDSSSASIQFRVLEGARIEEIAELVDSNPLFGFTGEDFLRAVGSGADIPPDFQERMEIPIGASLEGFLFPETYLLPPETTADMLRNTLIEQFDVSIPQQWIVDARADGFTMYEIVTLASIIEREAVHDDENPLISSVYRNRLEIGMKLDADPTVQYGLGDSRGTWWAQITQADYQAVQSPYNTYLSAGLPPGPIASPALAAIESAIYPAESDYFYFRARCDESGYHNFAETYEEHLGNAC